MPRIKKTKIDAPLEENKEKAYNWSEVMDRIESRNKGEDEFLQAVREIGETLTDVIECDKRLQDARIFERLTVPDRIITFRVCWEDDDGKVQINQGWRVQNCGAIGPYKGGLRFHPSVNISVLKFLAFEQTFKNALTGLPMGGGKGGADFDPSGRSNKEIMRFCQAFMDELHRHIGPRTDVPAGDINVGSREIGYLYGRYQRLTNSFSGTLTGKGLSYGGSPVRVEATGYGLIYFLSDMLDAHLDKIGGKTILISGAGNVALHAAEKAIQLNAKVLTLSDSKGTLHISTGFSADQIDFVKELKLRSGTSLEACVEKFEGAKFSAGKAPWHIKADIALPCATQNELHEDHAKSLKQNGVIAVAEGANMPCTAQATKLIRESKILYAPGKASNAGGVALSGLEMSQNAAFGKGDFEALDEKLKQIMGRIHDDCKTHGKNGKHIDYVKGANQAAFSKLADALLAFGI
ncbi:NADP-specific glutamate dehydrogenase [Litorimonas haliclonae]|uniref:NADP-specific glutamate dehydrogenase n=1 Tax=Litorimonas haliclonae TaxID=2081977 RepID=UPI0039F042BE